MVRIVSVLSVAAVLVASAVVASADQAICVTQKQAEKAAKFVKIGEEVRFYCAPCNDTGYKTVTVSGVSVGKDDVCDAAVTINDERVDLAYTYVKKGDKWRNLAMLAGAEVSDVPATLPKDLADSAAGD